MNNCKFCGSDDVSIVEDTKTKGNFKVECNSCGACSGSATIKELAVANWDSVMKTSDYSNFVNMCTHSEFGDDFTVTDGTLEYEGESIPTKDVTFLNAIDGTKVVGIFLASTEDLVGFSMIKPQQKEHKCNCGGSCGGNCKCK